MEDSTKRGEEAEAGVKGMCLMAKAGLGVEFEEGKRGSIICVLWEDISGQPGTKR